MHKFIEGLKATEAGPRKSILGIDVAVTSYEEVVMKTVEWAEQRNSRSLVFANVHVIMEAFDNIQFRACLSKADLVNPDGMPLVWALKMMGSKDASRVYGPDCTIAMLKSSAERRIPVGFYGGTPEVLATLLDKLRRQYPTLPVVFHYSPPFRKLTQEEDDKIVNEIKSSEARILFIGLGCPKQEIWMIEHQNRIPAVMFAVGAAFDFLSGAKKQAPKWMMRCGLEWFFRLVSEPKRLASRYLKNNPRFLLFTVLQLLGFVDFRSSLVPQDTRKA